MIVINSGMILTMSSLDMMPISFDSSTIINLLTPSLRIALAASVIVELGSTVLRGVLIKSFAITSFGLIFLGNILLTISLSVITPTGFESSSNTTTLPIILEDIKAAISLALSFGLTVITGEDIISLTLVRARLTLI